MKINFKLLKIGMGLQDQLLELKKSGERGKEILCIKCLFLLQILSDVQENVHFYFEKCIKLIHILLANMSDAKH